MKPFLNVLSWKFANAACRQTSQCYWLMILKNNYSLMPAALVSICLLCSFYDDYNLINSYPYQNVCVWSTLYCWSLPLQTLLSYFLHFVRAYLWNLAFAANTYSLKVRQSWFFKVFFLLLWVSAMIFPVTEWITGQESFPVFCGRNVLPRFDEVLLYCYCWRIGYL